jgi:hypothetical protein
MSVSMLQANVARSESPRCRRRSSADVRRAAVVSSARMVPDHRGDRVNTAREPSRQRRRHWGSAAHSRRRRPPIGRASTRRRVIGAASREAMLKDAALRE